MRTDLARSRLRGNETVNCVCPIIGRCPARIPPGHVECVRHLFARSSLMRFPFDALQVSCRKFERETSVSGVTYFVQDPPVMRSGAGGCPVDA